MASSLNEMTVEGRPMLLCVTSTGAAVHLAASVVDGRAAVPDAWLDSDRRGYSPSIEHYDAVELTDPRWASLTLCATGWLSMADTDAGALRGEHDPHHAPTCRRCLARLDSGFAPVRPDDRVGQVAALAAQAVEDHGSVHVLGVPGPQSAPLRRAIQRELRRRLGVGAHTWNVDDSVVATHDRATTSQEVLDYQREVVEGIAGGRTPRHRDWQLRWETWDVP